MLPITWGEFYNYFFIEKARRKTKENIYGRKYLFGKVEGYFSDREFNKSNVVELIRSAEEELKWGTHYLNNVLKIIKTIGKIKKLEFTTEISLRKATYKQKFIPTPDEVEKFAECYIERKYRSDNAVINFRYKTMIYTQYLTCARVTELTLLQWERVYHDCIVFPVEITKTQKERVVEIEPFLYLMLMELKKLNLNEVFVFGSQKGPMYNGNYNEELKRRAVQIGYTKPIHSHLFRHAGATHLGENGVKIEIISDLLGHSDINTTRKHYLHLDRSIYRDAVRQNPLIKKRLTLEDKTKEAIHSLRSIFRDVSQKDFYNCIHEIVEAIT